MNNPTNKAALIKRLQMARMAKQKMAGKGQAPAGSMPGVMPGDMNMMDMMGKKTAGPKK